MRHTLFITGTDTGVGKTVLTRLVVEYLRRRGIRVAAFKPLCSGGRADARALHAGLGGALTLDEINPWHFRAALTPALAARREQKMVTLGQVLAHLRARQKSFEVILIEGAGGLLSPLGVDFDSRVLMAALRSNPVIVAQNRLGAVNHVLLTREALPPRLRNQASVVLMSPARPDAATTTNAQVLKSWFSRGKILQLPFLGEAVDFPASLKTAQVTRALRALTHPIFRD